MKTGSEHDCFQSWFHLRPLCVLCGPIYLNDLVVNVSASNAGFAFTSRNQ